MTIDLYIQAAALALICFYAAVRFRRELHMLQQNSYRPDRYRRWLRHNKSAAWSVDNVTDVLMGGIVGAFHDSRWKVYAIVAVGLLCFYKAVRLLRAKHKKPLVFTARATRLYVVALAILAAAVVPVFLFLSAWWSAVIAVFMGLAGPGVMIAAVWLLSPVESAINRWYVNDARRILRSMPRLVVIGITGSYGKTSTKHYLHRILSERFSVVMTPGSFNTTLGVVRTVREHLKPYTEVFIVEMGAKQPGDIAEICELVKPRIGIITAVGEQHLESFGNIENVQRTKFELVDALPPDGVAILNDDFEYIASRPVTNVARVFRYTTEPVNHESRITNYERSEVKPQVARSAGRKKPTEVITNYDKEAATANYRVTDVRYSRDETTFAIEGPDGVVTAPFATRLAGMHNLSNVVAGYIAGEAMGMTDTEMRYAIASIEQVEHRLNIKHTPGGVTVIDDAFNSNPHGAAMALDVLAGFTDGRRIVVTPGMIELGARQEHYNRELGRQMAAACDIAVIVGEYNRGAIAGGLAAEGFPVEKIYAARDFADASRYVGPVVRAGDTILYENDLPDTFK